MEPFGNSYRLYKRAAVGDGRKKAWGVWQHCWHGFCARRGCHCQCWKKMPARFPPPPLIVTEHLNGVSVLFSGRPAQVTDDRAERSSLVMHYVPFYFCSSRQNRREGGAMAQWQRIALAGRRTQVGISK